MGQGFSKENLNKLILFYKIFFDTSSLLCDSADVFFCDTLHPLIIKNRKKVYVPKKVFWDIKKLQLSPEEKVKSSFRRSTDILSMYIKFDLIDIRADNEEPLTDDVFPYIFSILRNKYNLCLITQNPTLAEKVYNVIKHSKFIENQHDIIVFHLSQNGQLVRFSQNIFRKEVSSSFLSEKVAIDDKKCPAEKQNFKKKTTVSFKKVVSSKSSICTYGRKIQIYSSRISKTNGIAPPLPNDIEKLRYYIGRAEEKGEDHEVTYWDKLREIQIDALDFTEHRLGKIYENVSPLLKDAENYWSVKNSDEE